jgi:hypothetical protein
MGAATENSCALHFAYNISKHLQEAGDGCFDISPMNRRDFYSD